jgi:4'-phosphopantetheinyl transferase
VSATTISPDAGVESSLEEHEVHVWSRDLDVASDRLEHLAGLLSPDERERASRFRFQRDRDRFVSGRGQVRELLGCYLGEPAGKLRFRYSPYGKPALDGLAELHFNVSHSGHRALYAFSLTSEVGVDVELLRPEAVDGRVAERFFAPGEIDALRRLPPDLQLLGFLTCWTRKEAFIKARGEGLSLPLQDFEVTLTPGKPPRLLRTAWALSEAAEWELRDLSELCPDAVAALAVRTQGTDLAIHCHREWSAA